MRTKNSIKNMIASFVSNIITIIVGLVAQKIFINILGVEYLGLNGLFTNIISMLGIVELGIGSAIIYNLYKPIVDNDVEQIKSLMNFYKKSYHLIAFIVLIIGLVITPFLPLIIKEVTVDVNIALIYILFLFDIVCSYLLSYKRSILYASEKNYIINYIHVLYTIFMNISQLIVLYITKNYYLYLIIKIICRILENLIITMIANKLYSYLKEKDVKKLDKKVQDDIFTKIKALFFHKIGTFIVMGTDNIIISKFLGLIVVGLYSNYYLVISAVSTLFGQALISLTPSVGNMLVEKNTEKNYDVFKKMRFINFWIATFTSVSLLLIMKPFIIIWIGEEYLLPTSVLMVLVFNYYQKMMRNSYTTFKDASGIYHEDRFIPIFESITNIVVSIILVKLLGLAGVFIGTIVSGLWLWCYSYPKYVYKNLFERTYNNYAKETIGYILLFVSITALSYLLSSNLVYSSVYINFVVNVLISLIVPNVILLILFYKSDNFKYVLSLLKGRGKNENR